ncbi:hypothetical protein C380_08630 [Acidovorax sp. KKS102]|uniref:hypothetical protein n=1 Tax=Acidovorax sp. KKS102 TaxID=358220 RepID=UPI00028BB6A8|nr:hypothetical protein [Acidovorax sp. KKS102]AFU45428.1 hypothetical protein C380_08630 [Acidovorax sp. KKS102]
MKERPILFSRPMVRALLDGSKTQTRRVVKPQPDTAHDGEPYWFIGGYRVWGYRPAPAVPLRAGGNPLPCPYGQRGDRLWVRESFAHMYRDNAQPEKRAPEDVAYMADNLTPDPYVYGSWKPSIHMPRWASRITLEVTNVRVERLQDISEADAMAEGSPPSHPSIDRISREFGYADFPRSWYAQLWDQINGAGAWAANPWVWVVEFRRLT